MTGKWVNPPNSNADKDKKSMEQKFNREHTLGYTSGLAKGRWS